MKKALYTVAALGLASLVLSGAVPDGTITAALTEMQSSDWTSRRDGFYNLVRAGAATGTNSEFPVADGVLALVRTTPAARTRVVSALNNLLEKEHLFIKSGAAPATEDLSDYYGDLIQAVTTLRDASSIPVLLQSINTGGMAAKALAASGDDALSGALEILPSSDNETRHNLYRMLVLMSETNNVDKLHGPKSRALLSSALIASAADKNPWTRAVVARGLANLGTPEAIDALNRLAQGDSFVKFDRALPRYPVREAANKALQDRAKP